MSTVLSIEPSGRSEPHDDEAEQSVLGAFLLDQNAINDVRELLVPEDFYSPRNQLIYAAAIELADRGEAIDHLTLRAQLERSGVLSRAGGREYISELTLATPTAVSVRHYADIVAGHALRRRVIHAGRDVVDLGFDTRVPATEAADRAEQRIFSASDSRQSAQATSLAPILTATWAEFEALPKTHRFITGVPTNYQRLDSVTQGLQAGELVILAARPSVGKTSFALNIARNASLMGGRPVVMFSLEMTKESLVQRLLCSEAHVDSFLIRTGQAKDHDYQRIALAMDRLMQAKLWIDDTASLPISALRARARRMKAQYGIELIVVDYLQLMRGGRQESRVQEVSDISSGLKSIAKELGVAVLALSQLSRESEKRDNKRPQLSDLRDSGAIEQDADIVLFLYREGMHKEEVDRSKTELIVAKNRNGPIATIDLHFNAQQTAFVEPDHRLGS